MSRRARDALDFIRVQRAAQGAYLTAAHPEDAGHLGAAYRLPPKRRNLNLAPSIREAAEEYFGPPDKITWHQHASHGLSSQACCLNFLMPLATRPDALSRIIGNALGIAPPEMMEVETGAFGEPWYVGFEWIGEKDYLNEGAANGARTRGANATSADAFVRFRHKGRIEALLIEWKFTESYGQPLKPDGNPTRVKRYGEIAFDSDGPVRADLGLKLTDFFWEPFYQLLRQQMLAWRMQQAQEGGAQRVRVLHISPEGNHALHRVTAKPLQRFGDDAFDVFRCLLVRPDDFVPVSTEAVFGPILTEMQGDPWGDYLTGRYTFLARPSGRNTN